jgi:orotate phosphoribosyltransferase
MEEWPAILQHYCVDLIHGQTPNFNCCCGAPEGGKSIAMILARSYPRDTRYIYPEKKVTALATKNQREQSELVWSRHQPNQGDRVILCEDVCNNFSTTKKLIELIEKIKDAGVVAIACFLNRSTTISDNFEYNGRLLPILAVVRKPMPEWKQDDPEIECDVAYGNVVWKPKDDWPRLMRIMANF